MKLLNTTTTGLYGLKLVVMTCGWLLQSFLRDNPYAGQGLQVHAQTFISYGTRKFHVIELLSHVKWSYCWTIHRSLHREPSDNLLGELQNVI